MNRTDRLCALVEELPAVAPRPRSARQLAARYEVSTRTVERDILALETSGLRRATDRWVIDGLSLRVAWADGNQGVISGA